MDKEGVAWLQDLVTKRIAPGKELDDIDLQGHRLAVAACDQVHDIGADPGDDAAGLCEQFT